MAEVEGVGMEVEGGEGGDESPVKYDYPCQRYSESMKEFLMAYLSFYEGEDQSGIMESLKEIFNTKMTQYPCTPENNERRLMVDLTLREFLQEALLSKPKTWGVFLDLAISMTREELCSPSATITLLTDLVELSNLQDCSVLFDLVESRLDVWKDPLFFVPGKNAMLRMCNDFIRRQSRAQNTVFCGRILIFLANYFPFSERSGLNILSEFNVENVTNYKTGDSDDPDDKMEIAQTKEDALFEGMALAVPGLELGKIVSKSQEEKNKKIHVDHNLYVKFWSLQEYFRKPHICYNKVSWKTFSMYTQDVLRCFHLFKVTEANCRKRKIESTEDDLGAINTVPTLGDANIYFAKYLTNRRLLELQISDPAFRRYFLVQLLVILQYLTIPARIKSDTEVLAEDQLDFVKKQTELIYKLLAETPPHGRDFVKAIKHVLRREELWNKWKNDGCQQFKKPVAPPSISAGSTNGEENSDGKKVADGLGTPTDVDSAKVVKKKKKVRRRLGDSIKDAVQKNRILLGHPELTRLWNICPDNLEACRMNSRNFVPPLDTFFAEAFKEMEAEPTTLNALADPKKEVKPKKILGDPIYGWKGLRLLARRSPYFFQMFSGSPISPMQNYLEYVLKKIKSEKESPPLFHDGDATTAKRKSDAKPAAGDSQSNDLEGAGDGEQVMEAEAATAEDDELLQTEENKEASVSADEEEGEVTDKLVRPLTEDEQKVLAKGLGKNWTKLAAKLGFKADEVQFFQENHKEDADAAFVMLKNWQDQEDDPTAADLLYVLEGLKLKDLAAEVFKQQA